MQEYDAWETEEIARMEEAKREQLAAKKKGKVRMRMFNAYKDTSVHVLP